MSFDPHDVSAPHPWYRFLTIGAILLVLFLLLGIVVVHGNHTQLDDTVSLRARDWATPHRTSIMKGVTEFGGVWCIVFVFGSLLLWLLWQHRVRTAIIFGSMFLLAKVLGAGFKYLFARARPDIVSPLTPADGYSFPSGHTVTAVMVFGLIAIVSMHRWQGCRRYFPLVVAVMFSVAVGSSRIYLGVHYLTDVVGGMLLASACLVWTLAFCARFECASYRPMMYSESNSSSKKTR